MQNQMIWQKQRQYQAV